MTDPGLAGETVRVPASEVIHILDPVEAGQLRGVSRFAAAVVKLFTLDLYDDAGTGAEKDRGDVRDVHHLARSRKPPSIRPRTISRSNRARWCGWIPGEDVTTPVDARTPGPTYEPFQYRTLLQIGAALGVPYGYLTGRHGQGATSRTPGSRSSTSAAASRPSSIR